jgi:hypothetical protein
MFQRIYNNNERTIYIALLTVLALVCTYYIYNHEFLRKRETSLVQNQKTLVSDIEMLEQMNVFKDSLLDMRINEMKAKQLELQEQIGNGLVTKEQADAKLKEMNSEIASLKQVVSKKAASTMGSLDSLTVVNKSKDSLLTALQAQLGISDDDLLKKLKVQNDVLTNRQSRDKRMIDSLSENAIWDGVLSSLVLENLVIEPLDEFNNVITLGASSAEWKKLKVNYTISNNVTTNRGIHNLVFKYITPNGTYASIATARRTIDFSGKKVKDFVNINYPQFGPGSHRIEVYDNEQRIGTLSIDR